MTSAEHSEGQPVVIGYDGSEFAKRAIREAGRLFPGRRAVVPNTYPSAAATAAAAAIGVPVGVVAEAVDRLDEASRAAAQARANEGATLAREAGLAADGRAEVTDRGNWSALIRIAEVDDALAVVVGSRGLSGLKQVLLGSTSTGLVQHSTRPVVVVPVVTPQRARPDRVSVAPGRRRYVGSRPQPSASTRQCVTASAG